MGEAIVFTSGKGGVGKTTTIANIGAGLSRLDKKVIMLDTDMGLRNLDVVMGMEDQIQYNLIDLLENQCRLKQALIRDKRYPNLFMIPAALRCRKVRDYEGKLYTLISKKGGRDTRRFPKRPGLKNTNMENAQDSAVSGRFSLPNLI